MPIMAAHGQNDARVAARLLASTAVDCLRDPEHAGEWEVTLNNVYRLLEAFRVNPFFGHDTPMSQDPQAGETLAFQPIERHVQDVSRAIEQAIGVSFQGHTKDQAIKEVENVLRALV